MRNIPSSAHIPAVAIIVFLASCSTPQVVLDQAKNGSELTQRLSDSISVYVGRVAEQDKQRIAQLDALHKTALNQRADIVREGPIYQLSGQGRLTNLSDYLRTSADAIWKVREDSDADLAQFSDGLNKLMKPLPPVTSDLDAVGQSFSALSVQLTPAERIEVVEAALKSVKAASPAASSPAKQPPATPATPAASAADPAASAAPA